MFRQKNPFYEKLKAINRRKSFLNKVERAFYLGGFKYTSNGYEIVKNAIYQGKLNSILSEQNYDVREDNIELYLIENDLKLLNLIVIFDPYGLYFGEDLIGIIPCDITVLNKLNKIEQIFP
ncbi:hypothetical protein BCY89_03495 [Sphingobacterium siyangense]|uniref:Uncharacterized protein n=1 Tax=Sphingobacterium siyangense TaxID=459529 RepID=A0A420GBJ0_9SPHI|nr:hypothetical protein [Sphingobacterium siyangense]QRY60422.1 hypothetical protein JVX97_13645 [Sphingobacterium siyangense]RKF42547.1 hypothetical protein BCY89_03495 [Sphingobacterium siyangense]